MNGLGINLQDFLYQLVNFVILFAGLYWLLHKPLAKLLDDRRKEVSDSMAMAEQVKREAAEAEAKQQALLTHARTEAAALLSDARVQAKALSEKLSKEAETKSSALLARAERDIADSKSRLKTELKNELADLVVKATAKVVGEESGAVSKRAVEKAIMEIES